MQLAVRLRACPVDNTFCTFNIYEGIADVKTGDLECCKQAIVRRPMTLYIQGAAHRAACQPEGCGLKRKATSNAMQCRKRGPTLNRPLFVAWNEMHIRRLFIFLFT